jgi:hypothetical protein
MIRKLEFFAIFENITSRMHSTHLGVYDVW